MPPKTRHYRGRHVAPRRHFISPIVLTGLMVSTTATVGLPETASAFEAPSIAAVTSVSASGLSETSTRAHRPGEQVGRGRPDRCRLLKVIRGKRLKEKPPPLVLPLTGYHLTARFGATGLWSSSHTGLDFAADEGTPLRAIAPGTVVSSSYDGAFGEKTILRLDDGTELWYCHQSGSDVGAGERVQAGQVIGYVGSTGNVTGPHLHLEVHRGDGPSDPESWLAEHDLHP